MATKDTTAILVERMMAHGMQRYQAVAVALALEFASTDTTFAAQYGTFAQQHLVETVELLTAPPVVVAAGVRPFPE